MEKGVLAHFFSDHSDINGSLNIGFCTC
jgi:hypothetical protein